MSIREKIHDLMLTYYNELEHSIGDAESLLDVGCGVSSPISHFKKKIKYTVGIDGFEPSIAESCSKGIHDEYHCMDIMKIEEKFDKNQFDCVLASDVIEHFSKSEGQKLLSMMENIARKRVIIFTPNGFLPQGEHSGNPLQKHHSGWEVIEMRNLGFDVIGINGWKPLLGEMSIPKFRPHKVWALISSISQRFVRNKPEYAFQILCVKELA